MLKISKDISLPKDYATQTDAIIARKRVGKTYTASVIAEELIKAEIPIVVLDPTGAWWGLRSSADGKRAGFPVIIIGGAHADVPLEQTAGAVIADLVVDHPGYYVIDFSKFEHDSEIHRFATDFGKRFYFRKEEKRFPVKLIIDEADVVAPQRPQPNQTVMLHTYDNIVRRGGIRGIGVCMITQRPAVLNKNILTQCETLICLQISGSQDVDALEHWTRINGSDSERKELLTTVASLQMGEAWIWSPSWLQVFKKIHIRERETFNSSATPKAGEKVIIPQKLAAVDIAALGHRIRATAERQKENDPSELKKIIAGLRRDLHNMEGRVTQAPPKEVQVVSDADLKVISQLNNAVEAARIAALDLAEKYNFILNLGGEVSRLYLRLESIKKSPYKPPVLKAHNKAIVMPKQRQNNPPPTDGTPTELGKAERAILQVLANNPDGASKRKVAVASNYSVGGGSFNNALGKLRSSNMITRGEPIILTDYGRNFAPEPKIVTGEEMFNQWVNNPLLGNAERQILTVLWNQEGRNGFVKESLAANCLSASGEPYEPSGGSFNNALGKLRTLELIKRGTPIQLADVFYE